MAGHIKLLTTKEELTRLYSDGYTIKTLAEYYGVAPVTVRYWFRKFGIPSRKKGAAKGIVFTEARCRHIAEGLRRAFASGRRTREWDPSVSKEALRELYWGKEMSMAQIAPLFNTTGATICNWLKHYGIAARKFGGYHWQGKSQSEEHVRHVSQACGRRPNKTELKLDALLGEWFPSEWLYNGTGEHLVIGGKSPDFININGKKALIELFGDYWHQNDDSEERISHFGRYGYSTLIIWEHELKESNKLKEETRTWLFQHSRMFSVPDVAGSCRVTCMEKATKSGKAEIANPELGENPSVETLHRTLLERADEEKVRPCGK